MQLARWLFVAALVGAMAGCGGAPPGDGAEAAKTDTAARVQPADRGAPAKPRPAERGRARGTSITLRRSAFGRMLFDGRRQAIYIFENDRPDTTVCYGDCAQAWPPVYTRGKPRAGAGVRADLLGTIRRRDGRRQVTYAGQPLYFYAHERPGEVRCHNIDLNGGFWWVVGRDGKRRP